MDAGPEHLGDRVDVAARGRAAATAATTARCRSERAAAGRSARGLSGFAGVMNMNR